MEKAKKHEPVQTVGGRGKQRTEKPARKRAATPVKQQAVVPVK